MSPNLIPNILAIAFLIVPVFISLRAFSIYKWERNARLFILGLSMVVIALTAADNLAMNTFTIPYNTYWFLYLGQTVSFLFIWLSFLRSTDQYLLKLRSWHIFASVVFIGLLLSSPLLPAFPSPIVRAIVSGSRSIPCFGIFCCYVSAFMKKNTPFSFLMSLAFLLLTIGPWIVIQKYFVANPDLLDITGDITRLTGLVTLLVAILAA